MKEFPFITVVMPVRNEARFIGDTFRQILTQEYPANRFEIIVADGFSDDGTREIVLDMARDHSQLQLLDNPKRLSSAGRNIGFLKGRGDYFLVVDGHCFIPDKKLFINLVDCFMKSGADCLGRPQPLNPPGLTLFQKAVALARGSRLGHGGDSLIYGNYEGFASPVSNGAAYARHVFEKAGYVDEKFDACEDVEFNYRVEQAGLTCYTSPKLTIHYYPRENLQALWRQMIRYGKGRFQFARKHVKALTVNQLIPAGFVAGLLLTLILLAYSLLPGTTGLAALKALGALYGMYCIVIMLNAFHISTRNDKALLFQLPGIFFAIHAGLGIGFLRQALISLYRHHFD